MGRFDPSFEELPASLPVFPLAGALLLPRGRLPLNIFEPRYLAMVEDALKSDRLIGMVQPAEGESTEPGAVPALRQTGCAGRIVSFAETDDGRYLVTLAGVCRFVIRAEIEAKHGYRRVEADFAPYRSDLDAVPGGGLDRARLIRALRAYVQRLGLGVDWRALEKSDDEDLVTAVAMGCPFDGSEKQALLEAPDFDERARLMVGLLEMALLGDGDTVRH
jgi:hypothetical protein